MCSLKVVTAFLAVVALAEATKVVTVKNGRSTDVVLNVDGSETTVLAGASAALLLDDAFSGSITALPSGAEVTDGPKTKIQLTLGTTDSYVVSMVDGYNMGAKIIPRGSTGCSSSICSADINSLCPAASQVTNSLGTVVACQNSPTVMAAACPLAQVSESDATMVRACATATSYMVILN